MKREKIKDLIQFSKIADFFDGRQFSLFMCLIFVISAGFLIVHHEMWRDEVQAWLLIRDVDSLADFLKNLRYELHPFLWYALIYPLKFLTPNPEIMKPLHLFLAAATVYIFCRYAPFSRINKFLFIFGYFPFFEYGIIARDYSLILLLSFILASLYGAVLTDLTSKQKLLAFSAAIFFICQVHLLGVLIGSVFACLLTWEVILKKEKKALLPLLSGFLIGVGVFLIQILPVSNSAITSSPFDLTLDRILFTLRGFWRGLFPLPIPFLHFWNTNVLDISKFFYNVQILLALIVLVFSIVLITSLKEMRATIFYLASIILLFGVIFITSYTAIRFYGFFFIFFIIGLWLGYGLKGNKCASKLISLLLLVQVAATSLAYYYDMRYPFSSAKRTAEFIKYLNLQEALLVGYRNSPISPLSGYLGSKIFYPQTNRFGSFTVFDDTYLVRLKTYEVIRKAQEIKTATNKPVLVIFNYMPKKEELGNTSQYSLHLLGWFPISIVANEVYSIWIMK